MNKIDHIGNAIQELKNRILQYDISIKEMQSRRDELIFARDKLEKVQDVLAKEAASCGTRTP